MPRAKPGEGPRRLISRRFYEKHREEIRRRVRAYRTKNAQTIREKAKAKYATDAEYRAKMSMYQAQYREEHAEQKREYARKYGKKFRVLVNAKIAAYRQTPEGKLKQLQKQQRRIARQRGAQLLGIHTLQEWQALLKKHNNKCVHCGTPKNITRDHIVPITKGGSDNINNIQPLCRSCNSKKSNKLLHHTNTHKRKVSS